MLRLDDEGPVVLADGLGAPQGLAVHGDDLFTVDVEQRRLWSVSRTTGECRVEAEDLAVGLPPGVERRPDPALFAHGVPTVGGKPTPQGHAEAG
ncbi:hypothetical protein [Streptomyces luteogriseus]|uniref:hypothetical protein n=1 Tax=Streptomyces luteogriseus TaxID=68233 RepID=UPI002E2F1EDC|nr:hypothetical protein [Streptomyces luteogriseus]WTJ29126.1 hypothetical protein OID52_19705 [Streptomyces luteogriseus]